MFKCVSWREIRTTYLCSPQQAATGGIVGNKEYFVPLLNETNTWWPGEAFLDTAMIALEFRFFLFKWLFFFPYLVSEHKEGVVFCQSCDSVWTQLPVFFIGCFSFLWKRRWFPGWRGMATPLHFSPHLPPLPFSLLPTLCVSLSLARASQAGSGSLRAQHTDADSDRLVWLFLFLSSPFSPGRQSSRPADCCR